MAISDLSIAASVAHSPTWRTAVVDLMNHLVVEGECFSSGELARWLRQSRKDFHFSAPNLGEYVRDQFYGNALPSYKVTDSMGYIDDVYPMQVPRTTQGLCRTPAGVQVFVYCPESSEGFGHEFEVDIPVPGGADTVYPTVPMPVAKQPTKPSVAILGSAQPLVAMKARVNTDRRLQVPRLAFEAFVHFCGVPMKGGDPVYVKVDADKAVITLDDPGNGAKRYDLTTDRGRVLFVSPVGLPPFNPGDTYLVNIAPAGLTIDLTQIVKGV